MVVSFRLSAGEARGTSDEKRGAVPDGSEGDLGMSLSQDPAMLSGVDKFTE
jgi:hypothetical protein